MKSLLLIASIAFSLSASANTMLNGIGYKAHEMCFDGSNLVAQKTKSRNLYRQNGQGDLIVTGKVTVYAGQSFNWTQGTSYDDDGVATSFDRNGTPVVVSVTRRGDETYVTKTPVPSCK